MQLSDKAHEAKARRAAKKVGLIATKCRKHVGTIDNFGGFALVDQKFNYIVEGSRFDMTPDEVIDYCRPTEST